MKNVLPYCLVVLIMIALAFPMMYSAKTIIKKSLHKREMFLKLEQSQLVSIILPNSQVKWFEKGREIVVNNRMFDVKSWKVVGDSAIFHGLWDDKETALNKIIRKSAEKKREQQAVFKFQKLISTWSLTEKNDQTFNLVQSVNVNYTGYLTEKFQDIVLSLPKPPPELS
jgi:hypothetical protein